MDKADVTIEDHLETARLATSWLSDALNQMMIALEAAAPGIASQLTRDFEKELVARLLQQHPDRVIDSVTHDALLIVRAALQEALKPLNSRSMSH